MTAAVPRTIAFFVTRSFVLLDLSGALEAFNFANRLQPHAYALRVLSIDGQTVESSSGVEVATTCTPVDEFDTLFVIGGEPSIYEVAPADRTFVRDAAPKLRRVASVCIGAFILAATGLLDGRCATTHWMWSKELQERYPLVRVDGDRLFTQDGGIWTAAGVTAGIDLALAMIEEDLGKSVAHAVGRLMVMDQRRRGGQRQFSSLLHLDPESDRIRRVLTFARENLREPLPVARLAEVAHLSVRQFGRAFANATGTTPAKVVERLRVEAARPRVQEGRESLEAIARSVGFADADRMRQSFRRVFGQTPRALRQALWR